MKKIILLSVLAISLISKAQNVGISNTAAAPAVSAMLDIVSTNKGLLIPRVALISTVDVATIPSPAVSLLVYSTSAPTGGNGTGYYYWTGAVWANLIDNVAPGNPWYLNGNTSNTAVAVPGTYGTSVIGATEHFLGTTDAQDVVFGTNNIERMRILKATGNVGIGTAVPTEKLDVLGNIRFSGDLRPNNISGTLGQVLVSQGTGVAPQWKSAASILKVYSVFATRTLIPAVSTGTVFTDVTGLVQTITTLGPAILVITTYGSLEIVESPTFNDASGAEIRILQNGVLVPNAYQTHDWSNPAGVSGTINHWSFQTTLAVAAGTYTFKVQAHKYINGSQFDNFYAGGNTTAPLASQNQGAMIIQQFDQ